MKIIAEFYVELKMNQILPNIEKQALHARYTIHFGYDIMLGFRLMN